METSFQISHVHFWGLVNKSLLVCSQLPRASICTAITGAWPVAGLAGPRALCSGDFSCLCPITAHWPCSSCPAPWAFSVCHLQMWGRRTCEGAVLFLLTSYPMRGSISWHPSGHLHVCYILHQGELSVLLHVGDGEVSNAGLHGICWEHGGVPSCSSKVEV